MRKIIVGAQVSMDGVMQAPGGATEDPTRGFQLGGWSMPYFDQEFGEEIDRLFKEDFDLLLGRKTYEIFAAYWPYYEEDAPHGSIARRFKEIKKYAVSRSGQVDTGWAGSVLLRDIADVKRLKQEDGPNLVTQGSTVSGLTYSWRDADGSGVGSGNGPVGGLLVQVATPDGQPLDLAGRYSVTVNSFLAGGGDGFTALVDGTDWVVGPVDLAGLVDYLRQLPQPFDAPADVRVTLVP